MKYAKTQKGNPRSLTLDQHVFPVASLLRFADGGSMSVLRKGWRQPKKLSPRNPIFCARRAWDQRSEHGYMRQIEGRFQALADRIVGGYRSLSEPECKIVTEFYALWRCRAIQRGKLEPDVPIKGLPPDNISEDQREIVEGNGYIVANAVGAMPGRMMGGMRIQMGIRRMLLELSGARWGVAEANQGEFVVPDHFGWALIVPLTPRICLTAGWGDHTVLLEGVRLLNRVALSMAFSAAGGYLVAQDFSNCPL